LDWCSLLDLHAASIGSFRILVIVNAEVNCKLFIKEL
ncbi:Protein of unknown function, partial [Gryllus bimaculatus]